MPVFSKPLCGRGGAARQLLIRPAIALWALTFATAVASGQSETPPIPALAEPTNTPAVPAETPATTTTTPVIRAPSPGEELNTLLMHSTFLISGPARVQGQISFGTVFIMGIPYQENPKIAHAHSVGYGQSCPRRNQWG